MRARREPWYVVSSLFESSPTALLSQNCRKHHVKCDDGRPKCGRCQRSGRDCIRAAPRLQFLHSTSQQPSTPRENRNTTIQYVDETPGLTARYAQDAPRPQETATALPAETVAATSPQNPSATAWNATSPVVQSPNSLRTGTLSQLNSPAALSGTSQSPRPLLFDRQPAQPQLSLEEACLLRYFVEDLAKWFDLCDPERHFAVVVPQRARACPPLLDALLSASARHFSTLPRHRQLEITLKYGLERGLVIGEESTLGYHSRCIAHLRSVSDEPDAIMDENLLAAVVALRFYEELDSPFIDLPNDTAVRGLQVFLEAQTSSALSSPGFRQAVFWTGFRQEFHMAFSQQRPFRLPLDTCQNYQPGGRHAPDYVWVNYLLVICAQIVQYCFNDQYQRSYTGYEELLERRDRWLRSCPSSFSPIYFEQPDQNRGALFPKMWYLNDCHIVAIQSIGLTNILLAAYNPHTARIGLAHRLAMSHIDSTIRSTVREICGIALSNRQSPTALLTASIAITMCGERFTDHVEQKALMRILVDMSRDYNYWPTTAMQGRLREAWGWEDSPESTHQYEGP